MPPRKLMVTVSIPAGVDTFSGSENHKLVKDSFSINSALVLSKKNELRQVVRQSITRTVVEEKAAILLDHLQKKARGSHNMDGVKFFKSFLALTRTEEDKGKLVELPSEAITALKLRDIISTSVWMMDSSILFHLARRRYASPFTDFGRTLHPLICINALPEPGNGQLTLAKIPPRKLTFPAEKKRKKTTLGYDDTSKGPYASDFIPSVVFVCATRPRQMIRFEKLHHSPHDLLTIADATKEKPKKDHSKKRTISEIERAET
ncbi:hypothetical protein TNCV_3390791 [Trichonephila clavipes]|nr:hypothetical protein TNCV_3390791 [Trichonephila clavipes]